MAHVTISVGQELNNLLDTPVGVVESTGIKVLYYKHARDYFVCKLYKHARGRF